MQLTDICPLERWRELERKITEMSGLDANVFDQKGFRITDYKHWANRLCPAIKATDKGQSFICAVAHMNLAAQAGKSGDAVIEECDAGLVKLVVPIYFRGEFVGSVGACGLLPQNGEIDLFLINKIAGIEADRIERLSENIAAIAPDRLKDLGRFIQDEIGCILAGKQGLCSFHFRAPIGTPEFADHRCKKRQ